MWRFTIIEGLGDGSYRHRVTSRAVHASREEARAAATEWALAQADGFACVVAYTREDALYVPLSAEERAMIERSVRFTTYHRGSAVYDDPRFRALLERFLAMPR